MTHSKPRVGFDFDGVIMYNPARAIRKPMALFKQYVLSHSHARFMFPKGKLGQHINYLLHKSSFKPAQGYSHITHLSEKGVIEPFIITARWSFLKKDFEKWLSKLHASRYFKGHFLNESNDQPHIFKEKMIKTLDLDVFIEDNLDIVDYLKKNTRAEILWISNFFDRHEKRDGAFRSLKDAVAYLEQKYS